MMPHRPPFLFHDWNQSTVEQPFSAKVELCDETLRDGLQSPSIVDPPIASKLQILELMDALCVTIANIGLPAAGPRAFQDAYQLGRHARDHGLRLQLTCAGRTLVKDVEPIARIQHQLGIPIQAYCFLGASPVRQYVENWTLEQMQSHIEQTFSFANKEQVEVAFVTEDTTRSDPSHLEQLFRCALSLGCKRLVLCDTVGHATPAGVTNLVQFVKKLLLKNHASDVQLDWHGHNDRGLAVFNSLAAFLAGCNRIHGTCLGMGERSGNAAIDQLMVNLKLMGAYPHDLIPLARYIELAANACQIPIPYNYPVFGADAFRTATGVHAAAIIKALQKQDTQLANVVYSGVPAEWFGKHQVIEIGPLSGLSNVRYWAKKNGLTLTDAQAQAVFAKAKSTNRILTESEIWGALESTP